MKWLVSRCSSTLSLHGRVGEARPAGARLELGVRAEQLGAAAGAAVDAVVLDVDVLPGERPLGALLAHHVVLLGGQLADATAGRCWGSACSRKLLSEGARADTMSTSTVCHDDRALQRRIGVEAPAAASGRPAGRRATRVPRRRAVWEVHTHHPVPLTSRVPNWGVQVSAQSPVSNHYNLQYLRGAANARNDSSPTHTGSCSRCGAPHPDLRRELDGRRNTHRSARAPGALLDRWYESEILFGSPRCWGCCTQTEQRVILIGLLSDAA